VTSGAAFLLGMAAVFAVADWVAVARGRKALEYVAKPATTLLLLGVALTLVPEDETRRTWFLVALALCLAGDVFLMLPADLFVAGLAAFLLGHLAYVAGFGPSHAWPWILVVALVAGAIGTPILRAVLRRPDDGKALAGPVVAYMAAISVMVACAAGTGDPVALAGAALFLLSDSLIAWNRFVRPLAWAPVAIMVTYHLGQAGLVLSLLA
jgi:uncharacterized membrane protein YhhN